MDDTQFNIWWTGQVQAEFGWDMGALMQLYDPSDPHDSYNRVLAMNAYAESKGVQQTPRFYIDGVFYAPPFADRADETDLLWETAYMANYIWQRPLYRRAFMKWLESQDICDWFECN